MNAPARVDLTVLPDPEGQRDTALAKLRELAAFHHHQARLAELIGVRLRSRDISLTEAERYLRLGAGDQELEVSP